MKVPFVDLKAQYLSIKDEMDAAIQGAIDNMAFIGGGIIGEFEKDFAAYVGTNYCVACANGTDAIEIALKALGIGQGDEVIVPALTWISTGGAVNNVGAEPVFVDLIESERTIDPSLIEAKITANTKAIMPVHLYGMPARMDEILAIAKKHNLKVIEDCAQAHGAELNEKRVGTFGDIATFSFYPGKNLGAYGDAGGICTNDKELALICKRLGNHGQLKKHNHEIIGRNSRLDTLQAHVLKTKLPHLEEWTEKRIAVARKYDQILKFDKKPVLGDAFRHVFHLYVIQHENRDELMSYLKENDIGCAIHYPNPLPFLKAYEYKAYKRGDFPVSEKLCSEMVSIPMYAEMTDEMIDYVGEKLNKFE